MLYQTLSTILSGIRVNDCQIFWINYDKWHSNTSTTFVRKKQSEWNSQCCVSFVTSLNTIMRGKRRRQQQTNRKKVRAFRLTLFKTKTKHHIGNIMSGLKSPCACMRAFVCFVLQIHLLSKSINKQSDEIDGRDGGWRAIFVNLKSIYRLTETLHNLTNSGKWFFFFGAIHLWLVVSLLLFPWLCHSPSSVCVRCLLFYFAFVLFSQFACNQWWQRRRRRRQLEKVTSKK